MVDMSLLRISCYERVGKCLSYDFPVDSADSNRQIMIVSESYTQRHWGCSNGLISFIALFVTATLNGSIKKWSDVASQRICWPSAEASCKDAINLSVIVLL